MQGYCLALAKIIHQSSFQYTHEDQWMQRRGRLIDSNILILKSVFQGGRIWNVFC